VIKLFYILIVCLNLLVSQDFCVSFEVDISNVVIPDDNFIVLMNGSWNQWGWGHQLDESEVDNIYVGTLCGLNNGSYEYVHSITGNFDSWSGWGIVGNPPFGSECDANPNDSYANYGFIINNSDVQTQLNAWNCCASNDCSDWDGCYVGALQTSESYLYGRFEVRMKSADGDGIVSSFFTYNTNWDTDLGNLNWNEIDIEMTGNRDSSVQFTTHHPGQPNSWSYGDIISVDFNPHLEFHDYAIEWTPSSIKWFIDSEEVYIQSENIVDDLMYSQNIMMNIWPAVWENWVGEWDEEDTPKHAYYDFVKYYTYKPGSGNYGSNNNFELLWEDNFNTLDDNLWNDNSNGSFEGNMCSFSPKNSNFYNGYLILSLTDFYEEINCNEINGDVTLDSNLDILDIVYTIDVILNDIIYELDICQFLAIDFDCNQLINILDIIFFIDTILY